MHSPSSYSFSLIHGFHLIVSSNSEEFFILYLLTKFSPLFSIQALPIPRNCFLPFLKSTCFSTKLIYILYSALEECSPLLNRLNERLFSVLKKTKKLFDDALSFLVPSVQHPYSLLLGSLLNH